MCRRKGNIIYSFNDFILYANPFQQAFNLQSVWPAQPGYEPWVGYHLINVPRKIDIVMCLFSCKHSQSDVSENVPQWWLPLKAVVDFYTEKPAQLYTFTISLSKKLENSAFLSSANV